MADMLSQELLEAEVFATAGSLEKRDLLIQTYGWVDVAVNSLSGAALRATWECMAPFGRFVETGKADIYASSQLNMDVFKENVCFRFLDIGKIAMTRGTYFQKIQEGVMRLFREGRVKSPQPLQTFSFHEIQKAFRYMQSGAHSGKIVLVPNKEDEVMAIKKPELPLKLDPKATYVVSGAFGGMGREAARWMVDREARNLLLLSRTGGLCSRTAKAFVAELTSEGVNVTAPACDVSDSKTLEKLSTRALADSTGVAFPLLDSLFENMSLSDIQETTKANLHVSWNLHKSLPADLDFFILFSSAGGIFGSQGQSNYCAGTTFEDALARHRVRAGQIAASIDLSIILSVGHVAEKLEDAGQLFNMGITSQGPRDVRAVLDTLCGAAQTGPPPQQPSAAQLIFGLSLPPGASPETKANELPFWAKDPLFSRLRDRHLFERVASMPTSSSSLSTSSRTGGGGGAMQGVALEADYKALLSAAESAEAVMEVVRDGLVAKVSRLLGYGDRAAMQRIDTSKPLHAYGVDSLVAVELRSWLAKEMEAEVAVFDFVNKSSITDLAVLATGRSRLVLPKVASGGVSGVSSGQ